MYNDEYYRSIVKMSNNSLEHFITMFTTTESILPSFQRKHETWLHLLGLIETWDIRTSNYE